MYRECVIGVLYDYDNSRLVTMDDLITECASQAKMNEYAEALGLKLKQYTLNDYTDLRKSTNLKRFRFCPDCGAPIEWGDIMRNGWFVDGRDSGLH